MGNDYRKLSSLLLLILFEKWICNTLLSRWLVLLQVSREEPIKSSGGCRWLSLVLHQDSSGRWLFGCQLPWKQPQQLNLHSYWLGILSFGIFCHYFISVEQCLILLGNFV